MGGKSMRMIKKVALLLVLVLAFQTVGFARAESDATKFDLTLTSAMDMQAKEIMASSEMRAMVSVLLWMDFLINTDEDFSPKFLKESSYMGRNGLVITVYIHGAEKDLVIAYTPLIQDAAYALLDKQSDLIVDLLLDSTCEDGYYKNDVEDVAKVLLAVMDAINH